MNRLWTIILITLFLPTVVLAQGDTAVIQTVLSTSQRFRAQLQNGSATVEWTGLGLVSGDMVDMELTNVSGSAQEFRFVPGMVLSDPGEQVQPILLEENLQFTLKPGETVKKRMRGYCLDYSKEPPASGTKEDYEVTEDLEDYEKAVSVLYRGLDLDRRQKLKPVLRPLIHRTVVIQRAIWAVMGGENPGSEDELKEDLEDEIRYRSAVFPEGQLHCLSERIWADVQKIMADD
jgi:hypothetical protein